MANTFRWAKEFPTVYWHTSVPLLMKGADYYMAKNGSLQAAHAVVRRCVKRQSLDEIRRKHPDALLLVLKSDNQLPMALAQAIGLESCVCAGRDGGRWMNGGERLIRRPEFETITPRRYILVDDILVQGGTLWALRRHVLDCGGAVEAVATLACSFDGELWMSQSRWEARQGSPTGCGAAAAQSA